MNKKVFFVNGWFLQEGARINLNPENGLPMIYDGSDRFWIFHGCLTFSGKVAFEGALEDHGGHSVAKNGRLQKEKLTFVKQYLHRSDIIVYNLTRDGLSDVFTGTYQGGLVGRGSCRLVLEEAPPNFFSK